MTRTREKAEPVTRGVIYGLTGRLLSRWSPIIVSNRAPYEPEAGGGFRRGSGGLVTALLSLAEASHAPWVACARTRRERLLAGNAAGTRIAPRGRPPLEVHYVEPGQARYE